MTLEQVKYIFDAMNGKDCQIVFLSGGDPLAHPKINEILNLQRTFKLGMITAGLTRKDFVFDNLKNISRMRVSVDGMTPETYAAARGVDTFAKVMKNIPEFRSRVESLGINFTLSRLNAHEVGKLFDYVEKTGIDRLIVYPAHMAPHIALTNEQKEDVKRVVTERWATDGWIKEHNFPELLKRIDGTDHDLSVPCISPKIHMMIAPDGTVGPCCYLTSDLISDKAQWQWTLGNIFEEDILKLWRRKFNVFDKMSSGEISDNCKLCSGHYKFANQEFNAHMKESGKQWPLK